MRIKKKSIKGGNYFKGRKRQRGGYFNGTKRQRGGKKNQKGGFAFTAAAIALPSVLKLLGL